MSRALRKKTPMNVAIPPVVQAIEQQETRGKTRFFSATTTTLSSICMTIINNTALQKRRDNCCNLIIESKNYVLEYWINVMIYINVEIVP